MQMYLRYFLLYIPAGCGCAYTKFGCCEDGKTIAQGPDKEGCGCEASQFGCCADGITAAQGELFEGCEEEAPIVPGGKKKHGCSTMTLIQ